MWLQSCFFSFFHISYSPVLSAVTVCLLGVVSYSAVLPESVVNVCLLAVVSYSAVLPESVVNVCLLAVVSYSAVLPESVVNVCLLAVVSYSVCFARVCSECVFACCCLILRCFA